MTRHATRAARRRGWLAIALLAALFNDPVYAGAQQPKLPAADVGKFPEDECRENCFDEYVQQVERCNSVCCRYVLFIQLWCDEPALEACYQIVGENFSACMAACHGDG